MGKGRDIIYYALAYILGDILWQCLVLNASEVAILILFSLLLCTSICCCSLFGSHFYLSWRHKAILFIAFALSGALGTQFGGISREGLWIFEKAARLKMQCSEAIDNILINADNNELAVAKALAIGDKSMLDSSLKSQYKASGAMHLLALSGLHIGIVYCFLKISIAFIGNSPAAIIAKRIVILLTLWAYAFISGLSNSICRAVCMITVYEICDSLGSKRDLLRALAISAFTICIVNPDAPFSIGFQLSYSSVLGIYFIFPRLKALLECKSNLLAWIWNSLALSISCQFATSPLSWLYFGSFPKYFMVTNLLAIPLSAAAMYILPIAVAAQSIPIIGALSGKFLLVIFQTLNSVINIIATL